MAILYKQIWSKAEIRETIIKEKKEENTTKSNMLKRIANYFVSTYNGDDETAEGLYMTVKELREIASMNVELCRQREIERRRKSQRAAVDNAPDLTP
jgi:hypothetical protein